ALARARWRRDRRVSPGPSEEDHRRLGPGRQITSGDDGACAARARPSATRGRCGRAGARHYPFADRHLARSAAPQVARGAEQSQRNRPTGTVGQETPHPRDAPQAAQTIQNSLGARNLVPPARRAEALRIPVARVLTVFVESRGFSGICSRLNEESFVGPSAYGSSEGLQGSQFRSKVHWL